MHSDVKRTPPDSERSARQDAALADRDPSRQSAYAPWPAQKAAKKKLLSREMMN
jgi:hypothetical protein